MRKILSRGKMEILTNVATDILTPLENDPGIPTAFSYKRENQDKVRMLKFLAILYKQKREIAFERAKKRRHNMIVNDLRNNLPKNKISRLNQRLSEIRNYANKDIKEGKVSPKDNIEENKKTPEENENKPIVYKGDECVIS